MRPWVKVVAVVVALAAAGVGYFYWKLAPKIPEHPFLKPSGPYPVGTREYSWTDSSRAEPYTKDPADHRRVVVQVWYPAAAGATGDTALYLQRPDEFASQAGAKAARHAKTNSVIDAPLAPGDSVGFPIIVYNHGGAWTRWSATYATEWLASQGYVVFSVEHFGFNQSVKYPDGKPFTADTLAMPKETGDGRKDALASWAYLDDPVFKIWRGDARFTLDQIEGLARNPGPFQGRLDLNRIGAFGWSFGGALAIDLSAVDPRVKAAVDHDGQLFGEVHKTGTTRPVLQFHHGVDDPLEYPKKDQPVVHQLMAELDAKDSSARVLSKADWYSVTIAGTTHGDFSDLSLFYPRAKGMTDPKVAHEIIKAYTLAFFDKYLRGKSTDLLKVGSAPFAEATFRAWERADSAAKR